VPEFHRTCCRIEPSLSLGHPCIGFNRSNISFALLEGKSCRPQAAGGFLVAGQPVATAAMSHLAQNLGGMQS
jgi:hypothetical protein